MHLEELCMTPEGEAAPIEALPKKLPALVRHMRWHFVIDKDERIVFAGLGLAKAYACWLRCCLVSNELEERTIHEKLKPLLVPVARHE